VAVTVEAGGGALATGAGALGAGAAGIGGGGGAVLVTTGAAASAWASAPTAVDDGPWLECLAGALGATEEVLATTGIEPPAVRTIRRCERARVRTVRMTRRPP
jgi:hypothetical protein